jgi:hypothetical protein
MPVNIQAPPAAGHTSPLLAARRPVAVFRTESPTCKHSAVQTRRSQLMPANKARQTGR